LKALFFIFSALAAGDSRLFLLINKRCRCSVLDNVMPKVTHLGGAFFTLFTCLFLLFFDFRATRAAALEALIALSLSQAVVQLLKRKVCRRRPYLVFQNIPIDRPLFDFSFPSGHTTAGYALALAFSLNYPALFLPLVSLATLVGFSRTYLGFHYPLDVLMGAVVGGCTAFTVHHFAVFI